MAEKNSKNGQRDTGILFRPTHMMIHYDEIGLKGKNRIFFEKRLATNIKEALGKSAGKVRIDYGQIMIQVAPAAKLDKIISVLEKIPGIAHFSPAYQTTLKIDDIKKEISKLIKSFSFDTFKIDTQRHNKDFKLGSVDTNCKLGEHVLNASAKQTPKKVKLKNPDLTITVEICSKYSYISFGRHKGVGGLPVQNKNKIVCLLSGGIDSPIAAYMMMKRGAKVVFVHFQNKTQATKGVQSKIQDITKCLSTVQGKTKLYIVPFEKLQKIIIMSVPSTVRMLVYRRFMLRIAEKIARKERAKALVTGDSLSQVASQTIENLDSVYVVANMPVLTPLIGLNKQEIVDIARKVDTYAISVLPYGDCCSYFIAKHPEIKATRGQLDRAESPLDVDKLVDEAMKKMKEKEF